MSYPESDGVIKFPKYFLFLCLTTVNKKQLLMGNMSPNWDHRQLFSLTCNTLLTKAKLFNWFLST